MNYSPARLNWSRFSLPGAPKAKSSTMKLYPYTVSRVWPVSLSLPAYSFAISVKRYGAVVCARHGRRPGKIPDKNILLKRPQIRPNPAKSHNNAHAAYDAKISRIRFLKIKKRIKRIRPVKTVIIKYKSIC
jgi:hypothetical protein